MIGIVVVSHSHALARAAVDLAAQMVGEDGPPVEVAAGLDETTLGTDAAAVAEAIGRVDDATSGGGVLVLLDLGSAVLSAEMALEFVDPDVAGRVRLSAAPLVEGLVAATVAAGTGASLEEVAHEASQGLSAKQAQLSTPDAEQPGAQTGSAPAAASTEEQHEAPEARAELAITGQHGLHARPAARVVACVNQWPEVRVRVSNPDAGRGPANGRSLTALAGLDARRGHRLLVEAWGPQATDVVEALHRLAAQEFGEAEGAAERTPTTVPKSRPTPSSSAAALASRLSGAEAAVGVVERRTDHLDLSSYPPVEPAQEAARLQRAVETVGDDLAQLQRRAADVDPEGAEVFAAHRAILDDPDLREPVTEAVAAGVSAPRAVQERAEAIAAHFHSLSDPYQRERGQDVRSVGRRLVRALLSAVAGDDAVSSDDTAPSEDAALSGDEILNGESAERILVVDELDPADAATLDTDHYVGIITVRGGSTGHGVLMARARGIPVLPGAGRAEEWRTGQSVAFDARDGRLWMDPSDVETTSVRALVQERVEAYRAAQGQAHLPARTRDGRVIPVKANLGSLADAQAAVAAGAEGSGLVRTEVLFADRTEAPSVDEQERAFTQIAEALEGRPATIRTWDIGGDKPLPFLDLGQEANPFLGVRGLRAMTDHPELLVDQLEAICRVASQHPVRVMFPMVSTVEEVDWALDRLEDAAARSPQGRPDGLDVGIMVEVPAAALRPEALSANLDFVSIGSNDLTQYTLAADRGNAAVSKLADHADPAVLALIAAVAQGVAEGVEVCLCGDAASDPALAPLLVALGVQELSASPAAVPVIKAALRQVSVADLDDIAQRALRCDSAAEVRALLA